MRTYTPVMSAGVSRSARSSASDSGAISSSASSTSVQRRVASASDSLRAQPKSLRHSRTITFAPNSRAISTVRSVEPVSTTLISSTTSHTLRRHSARKRSSFFTIMHKLMPAGNCSRSGGGTGRLNSSPVCARANALSR